MAIAWPPNWETDDSVPWNRANSPLPVQLSDSILLGFFFGFLLYLLDQRLRLPPKGKAYRVLPADSTRSLIWPRRSNIDALIQIMTDHSLTRAIFLAGGLYNLAASAYVAA